jgi:hypothetical protein
MITSYARQNEVQTKRHQSVIGGQKQEVYAYLRVKRTLFFAVGRYGALSTGMLN